MTLSDEINRMILKIVESLEITSANPTHTNTVIQANQMDTPDLESMIRDELVSDTENKKPDVAGKKELVEKRILDEVNRKIALIEKSILDEVNRKIESANKTAVGDLTKKVESPIKNKTGSKTETKKLDDVSKKIELWDRGAVGEVNKMTSAQMNNFKSLMANPTGFVMQVFIKRFAKGAGVIALALIIGEAVKMLLMELMKPGRLLDIRFKRNIKDELLQFKRKEDQQKLRQGFTSVILTSMPGLRGSPNQAAQTVNSLDLTRLNRIPATIGFDPLNMVSSGLSMKLNNRRKRFNE